MAVIDDVLRTDVLVIGGGLAGMRAGLAAAPRQVLVACLGPPGRSGASPMAKGGIAAAVGVGDAPALHAQDTLAAGAGLCDPRVVRSITADGPGCIDELAEIGVPFDRTGRSSAGGLSLGQEAAHRRRRIVHAGGDATGRAIATSLADRLAGANHLSVAAGWRARRLLVDGRRVIGAMFCDADRRTRAVVAGATILATGGIGQMFAATTNPREACGDGLWLALEAGARLVDLEFIQFHPTALDVETNPRPLLSEALRGEGAWLVDEHGRRFMPGVDPLAELAPRDVVARAIAERQARGERVYLDVRRLSVDLDANFPAAAAACRAVGLDPASQPLPVRPAAHYHMGGVVTDAQGRTTVAGLWAVGEVASTGLHGANRLASNSLLEAAVVGQRAGRSARDFATGAVSPSAEAARRSAHLAPLRWPDDRPAVWDELRQIMARAVGLVRDDAGLRDALETLDALAVRAGPYSRTHGAIAVASLIALAALRRRESRGAHYRRDFPHPVDAQRNRIVVGVDALYRAPVELTAVDWGSGRERRFTAATAPVI